MKFILVLVLILTCSISCDDTVQSNGLDTKITFRSEGRSVKEQLEDLESKGNVKITVSESFDNYLETKTVKFIYLNTKIKYILRRVLNDIDLSYRVIGDIITVLK